ncbi:putative F-box protein PP2-B12 [Vicia villosa]|uniref:putative F-box protein PP2-B12 n=1 Tax=Vicia villosa TaxID=3911 RepID=UPI00273B22DE|nr:putative F-box protein PP2-B12 [Vicia villosa]
MTQFEELPEGCIATILSRTTPIDACRLSVVSNTFRSASDSDAVWNQFLPSDSQFMDSIISNSPPLANVPSKKALYLALSDRPIIVDNGLKSFQLDRKSGKICYMLAARSLSIAWVDDGRYWEWISMPNSRFRKVAKLHIVCWLDIRGMINMRDLSPNTQYAAYLVFNLINASGFHNPNSPVEISVDVEGGCRSTKNVYLDPTVEDRSHNREVGLQQTSVRNDGWLEIEIGEFFNPGLEDEEVQMNVKETNDYSSKMGLFVEGIEVRPK